MTAAHPPNALHGMVGSGEVPAGSADSAVKRALQAVRSHLGLQVAYVSEFVGDRSVFREVDAPGLEALIKVGDSQALDDVYCRHILAGRLPELMPDTSVEPLAMAMPITEAVQIGAHMSVPLRMADGEAYGMFCCLGFEADRSLNGRDLAMMKAFADLAAYEINRDQESSKAAAQQRLRIQRVIDDRQFSIAYQPICDVETHEPVGLECLARFSALPPRSPDLWFGEAAETGLGVELEMAAIKAGLSALASLPPRIYLAVNASAHTVLSGELDAVLATVPAHRVTLEITEHAQVDDYDKLREALIALRLRGVRLAVDDAGAGYAGLQHILGLQPDLIKLDMSLTRDIDRDSARRALASALIAFARDTRSRIIAEGVETAAELATLQSLGVELAQGYFLARPMPLESAVKLFCATETDVRRVA